MNLTGIFETGYTLIKKLSEKMASRSLQHTAGSTPHRCPLQGVFGQVSWDSPHHMCWQLNLHSLCDQLSYRSKAEFFPLSATTRCLHSNLYPRLNTIIHKLWSTPQKQVTRSWLDATRLHGVTEIHLCMPRSFKLHQAIIPVSVLRDSCLQPHYSIDLIRLFKSTL